MRVWIPKNTIWAALAFLGLAALCEAQANPAPPAVSLDELRAEVQELRTLLNQTREELKEVRQQLALAQHDDPAGQEEQQLLAAKVDDQYQSKVASGSRYRVRLSGLALMNAFSTLGAVDNLDLPRIAQPRTPGGSGGSFGATLRQSQLNLDLSGPDLWGAGTSGAMSFDFFGGFTQSSEGVTAGLARLRTARLSLDWANTSVVAGQDTPFFSPLSPSSLVSTAYPALSSSGNLWTWTPQIYAEHRFTLSDNSKASIAGGILDPLTGELPSEYNRVPTAGEQSRMPAYAMRLGWQHTADQRVIALGAGGYYARQNWGLGQTVDAWAVTADWDIPFRTWLSLSGELYRGRAIAGLGGGATASVLFDARAQAIAVDSAGGWAQLKWKPLAKTEFNAAFGQDRPFGSALRRAAVPTVSRNASGFLNVIYQARSNLLLSLEYRRLWTGRLFQPQVKADQVGLGAGVIF